MSVHTTFLIRKGTSVWVAKDISSPPLALFRHVMKHDLAIPYPTEDESKGPKVVALSRDAMDIPEPKRMMLKMFVLTSAPGPKEQASLLELLKLGFDVFVTDHETYPLMVVNYKNVDEVDEMQMEYEPQWDTVDMGDGLMVHRLKDEFRQALAGVHAPTKTKIKPFTEMDIAEC